MKTYRILLISILLCIGCAVYAQTGILTKEQAWNKVEAEVLDNKLSSVNVYGFKNVMEANQTISTIARNLLSIDEKSWVFFIDDSPFQSWEHACRYVFVKQNGGDIVIQNQTMPPLNNSLDILSEIPLNRTSPKKLFSFNSSKDTNATLISKKYAVIISGGMNIYNNYERYWNDCAAIYSTLVDLYNYDPSHIFVLMGDGPDPAIDRRKTEGGYDSSPLDLNGDGLYDIQYAATKQNISTVFNRLQNLMDEEDDLFIFTTDHGTIINNEVNLCLWGECITTTQFADELNKVNCRYINIVMEQCFSGGFVNKLSKNNRTIATACTSNESSWVCLNNPDYDEFVYNWVTAIAGKTPDGDLVSSDTNNDGLISMDEAFIFAQKNNRRIETPEYSSNPSWLGKKITLAEDVSPVSIIGNNEISSCDAPQRYTLTFLPDGATLNWNVSENLQIVKQGYDYIDVKANANVPTDGTFIEAVATLRNITYTKRKDIVNKTLAKVAIRLISVDKDKQNRDTYTLVAFPLNAYNELIQTRHEGYEVNWYNFDAGEQYPNFGSAIVRSSGQVNPLDNSVLYAPESGFVVNSRFGALAEDERCAVVITLPSSPYSGTLVCVIKNPCGEMYKCTYTFANTSASSYRLLSNPVDDVLNVQINTQENSPAKKDFTAKLYNETGLIRSESANTSHLKMDVKDLPEGTYYLHILNQNQLIGKQVILIKHSY